MAAVSRIASLALLAALAACGTAAEDPAPSSTTGSDTPSSSSTTTTALGQAPDTITPTTSEESDSMAEDTPSPVAEEAVADLAGHLDVDAEWIEIVSIETGVWSDGSIGCPQPGELYTQAIVPGIRVTLMAGDQTYFYHQSGSEAPFRCETPAEGSFRGSEDDVLIPPPGYDE